MKRILSSLLLFLPVLLFADVVNRQQAQGVAAKFLQEQQQSIHPASAGSNAGDMELELVWNSGPAAGLSGMKSSAPEVYLFNNRGGQGFVVVAGDDLAAPVLGYSLEGQVSARTLPLNFGNWMQSLAGEIRRARELGLVADETIRRQWSAFRNGDRPAAEGPSTKVGNIIKRYETASWDQTAPYYNDCPMYGLSRTVTGCLITATAIIMRFHQWPEAGKGIAPAYTTKDLQIEVPARDLNHPYRWELMPLKYYKGKTPLYTPQEAAEVAKLMADLGIALQANYGTEEGIGTGAFMHVVPEVLARHMGYDRSIHAAYRFEYTMPEWIKLIRKELNFRPVLYSGASDAGGHAFVLDGYDDQDYFHVNWGWSGSSDGWFLLTALDPGEQGTGGSDGGFNRDQTAILNMMPDNGGAAVDLIQMLPYDYEDPDTGEHLTYSGIVSTPSEILPDEPFDLMAGGFYNAGLDDFIGTVSFCWTDYEGKIKKHLGEEVFDEREPLELNFVYGLGLTDVRLDGKVEPGDKIKLFYKGIYMTDWVPVIGVEQEGFTYELELPYEPLDPEQRLDRLVAFEYDRQARQILLEVPEKVTVEFLDPRGQVLEDVLTVEPGRVLLKTSGFPAGVYRFVLRRGLEYKELSVKL